MDLRNENITENPMTIGVGGRAGAGKDTVADFLQAALRERDIETTRARFATPLRECVAALTGMLPAETATAVGKSQTPAGWGMTIGQMLQRLGTDAVRNHLHPDAWVLALFRRFDAEDRVVISDVRFPNEAAATAARQGALIYVARAATAENAADRAAALAGRDPQHVSETAFGPEDADIVIHNDGSLDDLRAAVARAVGRMFGYVG